MANSNAARRTWFAALITGATLLAAACSSSNSGGNSSPSGSTGSDTGTSGSGKSISGGGGTPTGSSIKIMASGILETAAANFAESVNGAKAAAEAINKAGGVNGHPIEIISCNDNLNANDAVGCARKAVSEKVVAYAGGAEPFDSAIFPFLERAKIPYIGPITTNPTSTHSEYSFPLEGEATVMAAESGTLAVKQGGPRVVVVQLSDAPASIESATYATNAIKVSGGTVAKLIGVPIATTNWSSYAAQIMNANPDGVTCSCAPQNTAGLLKALRQAGFTGPLTEPTTEFLLNDIKGLGSTAGKVYLASTLRSPDVDDPGVKPFLDEMAASQPSSALRDATSALSWLAVHVIADVLTDQKGTTNTDLLKGLRSTTGLKGHGLIPDGVNWAKAGPIARAPRIPTTNVINYQWDGSKLVEIPPGFQAAVTS
jgi:ABC-type branched-subunit amino acid transport system substrate-binding protein